jgi:hypothetical protein
MKLTLDLSEVGECMVTECAYNVEANCHARAITVGSGIHPACDTFLPRGDHVRDAQQAAGVGACKVAGCRYNEDLECTAGEIHVGHHGDHADCATFSPDLTFDLTFR